MRKKSVSKKSKIDHLDIPCFYCNNKINSKEKYVVISTINREVSADDHTPFHWQCWIDFYNDKMYERIGLIRNNWEQNFSTLLKSDLLKGILKSFMETGVLENGRKRKSGNSNRKKVRRIPKTLKN